MFKPKYMFFMQHDLKTQAKPGASSVLRPSGHLFSAAENALLCLLRGRISKADGPPATDFFPRVLLIVLDFLWEVDLRMDLTTAERQLCLVPPFPTGL